MLTQSAGSKAIQEALNEFERLEVWELVPRPDKVMVITLKWIYKLKLDEVGRILKNKARLVAHMNWPKECSLWAETKLQRRWLRYVVFVPDIPRLLKDQWFILSLSARPTEKHLHAVKRIFRYLRGTVNRGLWYPKDSSIALTAFADADHVGCQDTRRSTSGSMQFLGDRLVSWSSKRQKKLRYPSTKLNILLCLAVYQLADIISKALARGMNESSNQQLRMWSFTPETLKNWKMKLKNSGDTFMLDSEDSTVTYTAVSSPFGRLSNIGSPGVDGPPVMPEDPYAYLVAAFQALPSPDYVSGPKYSHSPDFVPELVYPEFMPPEDEVLPTEEQPLPTALSPTADSPGYVPESDPEEDSEEDDDEDPKEDPANYPADEGDNGDDEDESSNDGKDDVDIKGDKEEEEHPAPVDSIVVALLTVVARLLAIPTPPPLPLSLWSSPLPQIPSPPLPPILSPLPVTPPLHVSSLPLASPIHLLGYRAAMIRLRAKAPSTSH
ncbi:hypothetical protein Tco_1459126 [Tanacetum coccineum]